jgi:hypothetical protein
MAGGAILEAINMILLRTVFGEIPDNLANRASYDITNKSGT